MASFAFRLIRVFIVLGVALGAAFWLFNAREAPEKKQVVKTPPGVHVMSVSPKDYVMAVDALGTVVPRTKVKLTAEVPGRIDYIQPSFREGGRIFKKDTLIGIDRRSFRLDKNAASVRLGQVKADIRHLAREIENLKADANLARTNQALSLKELERIRALTQNQFASKTSLDKAEQQYLAARIQLQAVENRLALTPSLMAQKQAALAMAGNDLEKADLVLEKSEIRAGFDGFVLSKQAEMGEYVNPGQVLGAVYKKDGVDVDVGIPFEEVKWLRAAFDSGAMPGARISIANLEPGLSPVWQARVARVKAQIDEKTRTLPLTIEIGPIEIGPIVIGSVESGSPGTGRQEREDPLNRLKPGTFVKCRIFGEARKGIFRLPRHLLRSDDTLFVVKDNRLDIRQVSVLRKFEDHVFIDRGLTAGDQVITSPLPGARAGMPVIVKSQTE